MSDFYWYFFPLLVCIVTYSIGIEGTVPPPYYGNVNHSSALVQIRKCCPPNKVVRSTSDTISCEYASTMEPWTPVLYIKPEEISNSYNYSAAFSPIGIPTCKYRLLDNRKDIWFNILQDGSVAVGLNFWTIPVWLNPVQEYCVDALSSETELDDNDTFDRNVVLAFCELEHFNFYLFLRIGFGALFMISAASLFITIIIYLLIWDHHAIHGWTQFSFFLSFFLYYIFEGSRIFAKYNGLNIEPTRACFIHATFAQYCILALTGTGSMMSIDCFVTFWKLRSVRSKTRRDLIIYMFIAWIVPLIAVILGVHFHYRKNPDQGQLEFSGLFQYAHYRCSSPIWEFAYPVQLSLLAINVLAFVGTAYLILSHWRSTALVHANRNLDSDQCKNQAKKSIKLFLKLFSIMGIGWTLNAVDLLIGHKNPMGWPLILVRAYMSLQGVVHLVIFGLHRKNFVVMIRKYPVLKRLTVLSCSANGKIISSHKNNTTSGAICESGGRKCEISVTSKS